MSNIPYENIEIEQIFAQAFTTGQRSIAICAAESGEGVTSLALALAQRQLLAGNSVLLVDLNLYRPTLTSILDIHSMTPASNCKQVVAVEAKYSDLLSAPTLTVNEQNSVVLTGITAPNTRESVMKLRKAGVLEMFIEQWLKQYDSVIIDTSPLNRMNAHNIPPERIAAACDAAILVVLAGKTPMASISNALSKLNNAQAHLIGSVINDRDNPSLKDELLRETDRFFARSTKLQQYFFRLLNKSRLLTLEI
ncbi:AAA family ATPase [Psychromonas sp. Urea-02u-13]|uniref:AAA family ATPase n=1 Tax=Psychromonas sp. Urea-02u-13 TaxID=2058326 RepID=UPI000C32D0C3|nr:AAA family ATPase [Psychromonas sp. Urea-02u-13]PKG37919.1 protein SypD [Psychromonas sp. Urea-02u-13]